MKRRDRDWEDKGRNQPDKNEIVKKERRKEGKTGMQEDVNKISVLIDTFHDLFLPI